MTTVLRMTMTVDYHVNVNPDGTTDINGWSIEDVVDEWFVRYIDRSHATRDGRLIGNSEIVTRYEVLDYKDALKTCEEYRKRIAVDGIPKVAFD